MIPAQAVEAAASAAYEVMPIELFGDDSPVTWEQLSDSSGGRARKDHELRKAAKALEAAAPHMLAGAWEEAVKLASEVAWEHDGSASSAVSQIPNPYRPTP